MARKRKPKIELMSWDVVIDQMIATTDAIAALFEHEGTDPIIALLALTFVEGQALGVMPDEQIEANPQLPLLIQTAKMLGMDNGAKWRKEHESKSARPPTKAATMKAVEDILRGKQGD